MHVYTLIDISETKMYSSNSRDTKLIEQQANFMTFFQTLCLRNNYTYDKAPTLQKLTEKKLRELGFGTDYKGSHNVWCLEVMVDEGREFSDAEILEQDFDLVPVVPNLNETIKINNNVFRTNDKKAKNLVIKANIT
jgi:hypothetical protein|tara:strand:- start:1089 stop:1496 length:408 start_codon:yes stop_codon:yes gene_type:complete